MATFRELRFNGQIIATGEFTTDEAMQFLQNYRKEIEALKLSERQRGFSLTKIQIANAKINDIFEAISSLKASLEHAEHSLLLKEEDSDG